MKQETISVLYFLVLQNLLFVLLWMGGYQTALSQAIGSILIGIAVILWFNHEDKIKATLERIDKRNE